MPSAISNTTQSLPVVHPASTPAPRKPTPETPDHPTGGDTVQLSKAALAAAAVLQEARETPAQTSREAGRGDLQATRLLARESAAHE